MTVIFTARAVKFRELADASGPPEAGFLASTRALSIVVTVPIRTRNQNAREHYAVRAKRVKEERRVTRLCLDARSLRCPFQPPIVVTLTRGSSGRMDSDGVVGACKSIRDEVSAWIGIDDRHDELVEYRYARARTERGVHWVKIEVRVGT